METSRASTLYFIKTLLSNKLWDYKKPNSFRDIFRMDTFCIFYIKNIKIVVTWMSHIKCGVNLINTL